MIAPIGTFLTGLDTAVNGGMQAQLQAMCDEMSAGIVAGAASILYLFKGLEIANGNNEPFQRFVPELIGIGVVLWLSTNLAAYDQWVVDTLYIGLPAALTQVVAGASGATGAQVASGVGATAAMFDQIWDQLFVVVGTVWAHAGLGDWTSLLAGALTAMTGGLGLVFMAMVYIGSRFLAAVMFVLFVAALGCWLFRFTRPIFERALHQIIALIFLQIAGVIVLQIVLTADRTFMGQIIAMSTPVPVQAVTPGMVQNYYASSNGAAAMASELQALAAITVMFCAGAFAMLSLPMLAYSLGTGVAVSTGAAFAGAAAGTALAARPAGSGAEGVRQVVSAISGQVAWARNQRNALAAMGRQGAAPTPPPAPPPGFARP